ncbi:hypothetical protein EDD29_7791 [Actinocorallia herbida]|uniref:Uncharacterized protein n=1 Tax=Actinocorallia herbida TaxID=58109 RepID=A0A3N1D972_9ACTN|nr:hypothetical protein [Actinocorallia herbida]ROO90075.1 hypothetical protein EDD29_7791 [Actinocorallia herbida]
MRVIRSVSAAVVVGVCLVGVPGAAGAEEGWRNQAPVFTAPERGFSDVAAVGAREVWAVGYQGRKTIQIGPWDPPLPPNVLWQREPRPVLQQWTGRQWKAHHPEGIPEEGTLDELEVSGGKVWALGTIIYDPGNGAARQRYAYIGTWNGTEFVQVNGPTNTSAPGYLRHLSADSGGLWMTEGTQAYRFVDGPGWTGYDLGSTIKAIESYDSGEAWASGSGADGSTWVRHWDGSAWTSLALPAGTGKHTFQPTGPAAGWVATDAGLALWDGTAWTTVAYPEGYTRSDLWPSFYNAPWATTDVDGPWLLADGLKTAPKTLLHWTGSAWLTTPGTALPLAKDGQGRFFAPRTISTSTGENALYSFADGVWTPVPAAMDIWGGWNVAALPGTEHVLVTGWSYRGDLRAYTNAPRD